MSVKGWASSLRRRRTPKHDGQEQGLPITRPRRTERFAITSFVMVILLAFGVVAVGIIAVEAKHDARAERSARVGIAQALGTANVSLSKNGLVPVATPTVAGPAPTVTVTVHATGPAGATGLTGPGPSAAAVQLAVDAYCGQRNSCTAPPSFGQVASAVAQYCNANGQCRGADGKNGSSGHPGQPGASGAAGAPGASGAAGASGAPGQNATPDQINAAVVTYCAQATAPCKGDPGATGPSGPPGPAGVNGAAGANGSNGTDGSPPYSWTYTDALGLQHTCVRTDPFDAAQPTYTCK